MSRPCTYPLLKDKEWLYQKYVIDKLSSVKISKILGCAPGSVISALKRRGIPNRTIKDTANRGHQGFRAPLLNNKKWLKQRYVNNRLSARKIAKLIGVSESVVLKAIKYHKISTRQSFEDLTGKILNNWTVIRKVENSITNETCYLCKCKCGIEKKVLRGNLATGISRSCGCLKNEKIINNKLNKTFGNLKILRFEGVIKHQNRWKVRCLLCGSEKIMSSNAINYAKSCGCSHRIPVGEAGFNKLFSEYKCNAIKRNLEFSLTKEEFRKLTQQNCYYCGERPKQISKGKNYDHSSYLYNGVDRLNNDKGYTKDNCVPCCGVYNLMKRKLSYNFFVEHIKKIYKYLNLESK